ncbi:hypothetical protein TrST_g10568 [Triparma strigata]|uniref:Uncharacterized protein n=1 Tax=Triparma strigata TaxID=1606541 RepID=A0A9W7ATG0_9STRA|nr:hypothetical protein TrST_g10568 [Triparma strigata]
MASFDEPKPISYVKALVERGDKAYASMEPQLATKFYQESLRHLLPLLPTPSSSQYASSTLHHCYTQIGECLIQLNNPSAALESFTAALEINETAEVHLLRGQLLKDEEALDSFKKGVQILEKEGRKKLLCQAYSNIAELWMTDLCMSPLAESSCESSVAAALSNDEGVHPDGFQALSSLRLSQRRGEDAANAILKAYGMMEEGVKAGANTVGLGSKDIRETASPMEDGSQALELTSLELSSIDSLPGFEFRTQTSKLLLECSSVENLPPPIVTALGDAAVAVLGSLLCENDEVVETFFLLGCAFARLEEGDEAMNYLNRAKEMLEKVKKGIEEELNSLDGFDTEGLAEQAESIEDQMDMISDKITEISEGMEVS